MSSLENIDLRLKLLSGEPIYIEGAGYLKPLTLRYIAKHGYATYLKHLNTLTTNIEDLFGEEITSDDGTKLNLFDLLLSSEESFIAHFVDAIKFFFQVEEAEYFPEFHNLVFGDGNRVINHDIFVKVKEVIEYQNYISDPNKARNQYNPKDERARLLIKKMEETRKIVNKLKGVDAEQPDFVDIISAVSTRSNVIGKHDVWNLTIYQLYDEFSRLRMIDEYEVAIKATMAGASGIEITHWSSKVKSD